MNYGATIQSLIVPNQAGQSVDVVLGYDTAAAYEAGDGHFGGYDHNYALSGGTAAKLFSTESGIELTIETDLPGMQLYTANSLTERAGKSGQAMLPHGAVCLETQLFPNAMNCWGFPSPVLHRGEHLHSETTFSFSVR